MLILLKVLVIKSPTGLCIAKQVESGVNRLLSVKDHLFTGSTRFSMGLHDLPHKSHHCPLTKSCVMLLKLTGKPSPFLQCPEAPAEVRPPLALSGHSIVYPVSDSLEISANEPPKSSPQSRGRLLVSTTFPRRQALDPEDDHSTAIPAWCKLVFAYPIATTAILQKISSKLLGS